MISYDNDPQPTIPESSVKIVGIGGAGANMLDRAALDGMTGAELLCANTDMRTLSSSTAGEKIQIGKNLTKGLGAGGDPELGLKAAQESELEIRDSLRGRKMVFLCVGLGGGTGSGAAPLIARIAREEGAFVVIFATMPFGFEGRRRRDQAETALNELAVLANALVTFDNGRMGELVLAKQGIHEAFAAADRMISESIKAVTRLVVRPGLINVGLDDLMTALKTTRSRCLFGSGIADGENRSQLALENALTSPLLDKGSLLADAATVLVHICGGKNLTLHEVELLMQELSKYIPASAHVLFGAAVDPAMGDSLSVTLVSALPEDKLNPAEPGRTPEPIRETPFHASAWQELPDEAPPTVIAREDAPGDKATGPTAAATTIDDPEDEKIMEPSEGFTSGEQIIEDEEGPEELHDFLPAGDGNTGPPPEEETAPNPVPDFGPTVHPGAPGSPETSGTEEPGDTRFAGDSEDQAPFAETGTSSVETPDPSGKETFFPRHRQPSEPSQAELELDGGPKGKFEGESPNLHGDEDLDLPAFLRRKRK